MKFSNELIPHMFVKLHTVFCQILVFGFWIANAGVQIPDILCFGYFL